MRAEAFVLHMTCDHLGCHCRSYEYVGRNKTEAKKVARSEGWLIGPKDYCRDHKRTAMGKTDAR